MGCIGPLIRYTVHFLIFEIIFLGFYHFFKAGRRTSGELEVQSTHYNLRDFQLLNDIRSKVMTLILQGVTSVVIYITYCVRCLHSHVCSCGVCVCVCVSGGGGESGHRL